MGKYRQRESNEKVTGKIPKVPGNYYTVPGGYQKISGKVLGMYMESINNKYQESTKKSYKITKICPSPIFFHSARPLSQA